MTVGVLRLRLMIPGAESLKAKRGVILSLKTRITNKFNVSAAEVDDQDSWQVATLGLALVGTDAPFVQRSLESVVRFVESQHDVEIIQQNEEFFSSHED